MVDLALTSGASSFVEVSDAHVSGVSVITGGEGLMRFLDDLTAESAPGVSIPTTLNSAGCDGDQIDAMDLGRDGFLEAQMRIIEAYTRSGLRPPSLAPPTTAIRPRTRRGLLGRIQRCLLREFMDGNAHEPRVRPLRPRHGAHGVRAGVGAAP